MSSTELSKTGASRSKLTDKQRRFIAEYLVDYNGTRAARAAGYKHPSVASAKLLDGEKYPHVTKLVGKAQNDALTELNLTRQRILQELAYCGLRDPVDLLNKDGYIEIESLRDIPEKIRRCIDGIEVRSHYEEGEFVGQTVKLKLVGKLGAIELLMKHFGMLDGKQEEATKRINWDELYEEDPEYYDPIEDRIRKEEQ